MAHTNDAPDRGQANGVATLGPDGKVPLSQIPDEALGGGPPSGPAGGDLAGTYPNPTVARASNAFAMVGVLSPPPLVASQNDYNPANLATAAVLRLNPTVDMSITGLAGGSAGRIITVYNVGSAKLSLIKESASSTAANRFALDNDALVTPNTAILLQYDAVSSRWRVAGAGSSVPTLLPAPKFFRVTLDTTTTQQPPGWATLFSGNFSLAASETNLIVLLAANISASNSSRRIELRVLVNGVFIGGSGGTTGAANIPFSSSFLGQIIGVAGNNTFEVQWRVNSNTANCRPVTFPDENASVAFWSSAAL